MRTRSSVLAGHECSARRRWHAIAQETASLARPKATKNESLGIDLVAAVLGERLRRIRW